jgi:hypothetical protein
MATPIYNAGLKPPVLSALRTIDAPPSLSPLAPMSAPSLPPMDAPVAPDVTVNPRISSVSSDPLLTRKDQLESDLYNRSNPVAPTSALGKIGHVASRIGNVLGDIFAPATMSLIPGTDLNNQVMRSRDISELQDNSQLQTDQANRAQTAANTAFTEQKPAIAQAGLLQKKQISDQKNAQLAASHGLMPQTDEDGVTTFVPDDSSPIGQLNLAKVANTTAQNNLRDAQTAWEQAKMDPNSQAGKIAWGNLQARMMEAQAAQTRAHTSVAQYMMHAFGTDVNNNPLAGTMITDDGRSVGTSQAPNVRPTGQERNKADMAYSAGEQLNDITDIMQKNPTLFGPGYGQSSAFKSWVGAQSPDAQRFVAARTIAADHLAGTFGGRSEAALSALDNAIGQYKDNPQAAMAGISQLIKANSRFENAGTVRTAGSNAAKTIGGVPSEGQEKKNSAGMSVVYRNGAWGLK